jgi:hypothetical protein
MPFLLCSWSVLVWAVLLPSSLALISSSWDLLSSGKCKWELHGNFSTSGLASGLGSIPAATVPGYAYDALEAAGLVQNPILA